jgi:hypothetical protein
MTTFDAFSRGAWMGGEADESAGSSAGPHRVEARRRDADPATERRWGRLVALAQLMDNRWEIPGTGFRVGLDSLIGLVPGVGDVVTTGLQGYIIFEAWRLGATKKQLAMMVGNVAIDFGVGFVPGLGDVFDTFFKANVRNLRILGIECGGTTRTRTPRASPSM